MKILYIKSKDEFFSKVIEAYSKYDFGRESFQLSCMLKDILGLTRDNFGLLKASKLKLPTQYVIERLESLRHKDYYLFTDLINNYEDIIRVYGALFKHPYEKIIHTYYNDIWMFQPSPHIRSELYDDELKRIIYYTHESIIDFDSILNKYGIYILYNASNELIYIGKSYNLGKRLQDSIRQKKASYYSYCLLDSKKLVNLYEKYYIAKYQPTFNVAEKDFDISNFKLDELSFTGIKEISNRYDMILEYNKKSMDKNHTLKS